MKSSDAREHIYKLQESLLQLNSDSLRFEIILQQLNRVAHPYKLELYFLSGSWVLKTAGGGKMRFTSQQFEEAVGTFLTALVYEVRHAPPDDTN